MSWPTGIQLGVDVIRPLQYKFYESEGTQYEINAAVDIANYILEGDYGYGDIHWQGRNKATNTLSSYTSSGRYFRLGLNYNLLPDTPDKNMAFLGFRYARSSFKDHLVSQVIYDSTGLIKDHDPIKVDSTQNNGQARWFEAVAGTKVKLWNWLYIGGTLRYGFGLSLKYKGLHTPYDVIGWGLNNGKALFSFNLYISLRIPFTSNTLPNRTAA
ncbi:MAG: DUF6048 family protein [Bacteroidota bacterium]